MEDGKRTGARHSACTGVKIACDERGTILMLVLIVLVTMIIMGMALIRSTTMESRMAGNDLQYQKDFYLCEAAGELAKERFDEIVPEEVMDGTTKLINVSDSMNAGPVHDAKITISYDKTGNPPVNSGSSPATAFSNYYVITATVKGKTITKGVYKVFPKSE